MKTPEEQLEAANERARRAEVIAAGHKHGAINPEQLPDLVNRDLAPSEGVAALKDDPNALNLFVDLSRPDVSQLTHDQYMHLRKANPAALGLSDSGPTVMTNRSSND